MIEKRYSGLDLVRAFATISIIGMHFFLYVSGFYSHPLNNTAALILALFRPILYCCVPLFVILSGFLKINKVVNKSHYKTIVPILVSYVVSYLLIVLFKVFYLKEPVNFLVRIQDFFWFSNSYAWYIEMYIGLFLLMPLINLGWKNINNKKSHIVIVFSALFITSLPSLFNIIKINDDVLTILPDWWIRFYPVTYYLLGLFIVQYRPKINRIFNIALIFVLSALKTAFVYFKSNGRTFLDGNDDGYSSLFVVIISVLLFLLLYDINVPSVFEKLLKAISLCSLDIYLVSYMFDLLIYKVVAPYINFSNPVLLLIAFLCMVLSVFSLSFAYALLKKFVFGLFKKREVKH